MYVFDLQGFNQFVKCSHSTRLLPEFELPHQLIHDISIVACLCVISEKENGQVWDTQLAEKFRFSHRLLQWTAADRWLRPLYTLDTGIGQTYPQNYLYNTSACTYFGCGQLSVIPKYSILDYDVEANYTLGISKPGLIPIPSSGNRAWTILQDSDGSGAVLTLLVQGGGGPSHRDITSTLRPCPIAGCWSPPPPPPVSVDQTFGLWSDPDTWNGTLDSIANPLNVIEAIPSGRGEFTYKLLSGQKWQSSRPGPGEDVWIPPWKKVLVPFVLVCRFLSVGAIDLLSIYAGHS